MSGIRLHILQLLTKIIVMFDKNLVNSIQMEVLVHCYSARRPKSFC